VLQEGPVKGAADPAHRERGAPEVQEGAAVWTGGFGRLGAVPVHTPETVPADTAPVNTVPVSNQTLLPC
jgi:hypothetical protein